jgi:hypothetical protein
MLSAIMLSVIMLSVILLSVIMLSVIMLSVIMLNVIRLSLVMPSVECHDNTYKDFNHTDLTYNINKCDNTYSFFCLHLSVKTFTITSKICNVIKNYITHFECYEYFHNM